MRRLDRVKHLDALAPTAAVRARGANDWAKLAQVWADHGLSLVIYFSDRAYAAYYDIPDDVLVDYPELALASSVISAHGPNPRDPSELHRIRNYREAGWVIRRRKTTPSTLSILDITGRMITARYHGDIDGALRIAKGYVERYPETRTSRGSIVHQSWFKLQWAITAWAAGEVSEALNLLSSAAYYAWVSGFDVLFSAASTQLALINAVAGHTAVAADYLANHEDAYGEERTLYYPVRAVARLARATLQLDQLDPASGDSIDISGIDQLEEWAVAAWVRTQHALLFDDPILAMAEITRLRNLHHNRLRTKKRDYGLLARCVVDLGLALGELNRTQRHIHESGAHLAILAVPRSRLAFISGDYAAARSLASAYAWDPAISMRDRIDLVMLKAATSLKMGEREQARHLFSRAHHLASQANTLIPYATLPASVRNELLDLIGNPLGEEELARISAVRPPYPEHAELISLSSREMVVLKSMAEYETLPEIADKLVVSLNTVKKQAQAIYVKLGVHDRRTALLEARRLGLLLDDLTASDV